MKDLLKIFCCWFAFFVSMIIGGVVIGAIHLPMVAPGHEQHVGMPHVLLAAAVLVLGIYPIARGIAGTPLKRGSAIAIFIFIALGLNTVIEARVFSSFLTGAVTGNLLMYGLEALCLGAAFGMFFGRQGNPQGLVASGPGWSWRLAVAWIGWPVIYFIFGSCIAPIVIPYYQTSLIGLHIPPPSIVFATQLVRSVTFFLSSIALVSLWKGSRRSLWLSLGLAHTVAVGLFGMVSGTFLPMILRVTHSCEITADSFAYAGLLVLLFRPVGAAKRAARLEHAMSTK